MSEPAVSSSSAVERRAALLARLRARSPTDTVAHAAVQSAVAGFFMLPVIAGYCFMDGMLSARFPRPPLPGEPARAPIQTFPGMLAFSARHAAGLSTRTFAWLVLSGAGAAAGSEVAQLGPRYQDLDAPGADPRMNAVNFASGALSALVLTVDWSRSMGGVRRGIFIACAGGVGVMMPYLMMSIGPRMRKVLAANMPAAGGGGEEGSSSRA